MQKYVGCKVIKAEPCKAWKDVGEHKIGDEGYKVVYTNGYVSWSPKDVFEAAYTQVPFGWDVTQENLKDIMDKIIAILILTK